MNILLTAFGPFGGETVNPALEAARDVPSAVNGAMIAFCEVPVTYGEAVAAVLAAVEKERPDAILCVGQAGGRAKLTPERIGINLDDSSAPDNAGECRRDKPIDPEGPAAYFSTLPVKRIAERINLAGIPSEVSNTAGTYVCNHLLYGLLHSLDRAGADIPCGFIHVPYLPEQIAGKGEVPCLAKEKITEGLILALETIAEAFA